jgi:hypothetical protein
MDGRKMPVSDNFEDRTQEDIWAIISRRNPKGELKTSDPYFQFLRKRLYDDQDKVAYHCMRMNDYKAWPPNPNDIESDLQWKKEFYNNLKKELAEDISEMRKKGPIGRQIDKIRQWYKDRQFEGMVE